MSQKIAYVTGGMGGIGTAICQRLHKEGFKVIAGCGPTRDFSKWLAEQKALGYTFYASVGNVGLWESTVEAFSKAKAEHGPIDVLVNNAGITRDQLLVRMKDDDWDQVLDTNLRGVFLMTRAVGKVMMRQKSGRIINISSTAGAMGNPGQVNYSAAKAGVIGLTKAAGRELAHWNILVNAVAPGLIETDMAAAIPAEAREAMLQQVPLKRIGQGREVAEVVRFLAGDGASYITGQTIHVNGGLYA